MLAIRRNCGCHAFSDNSDRQQTVFTGGLTQKCEFATEFIKHSNETLCRRPVGGLDVTLGPKGLDDQIDRSIMKMQSAAVGQQTYLSGFPHWSDLHIFADESGQRLSARTER